MILFLCCSQHTCSLYNVKCVHIELTFAETFCIICLLITTTPAVLVHLVPTNNNCCFDTYANEQTEVDGVEGYDITEAILTLGRDAKSSITAVAASRSYEV
jgi:hypothetical protein